MATPTRWRIFLFFTFILAPLLGYGQCELMPGSKLIDANDQSQMENWMAGVNQKGTLIYRMTRDGMSAAAFHHLCDNQGPTLVLVKSRNTGQVFGGYNPQSWRSVNNYVPGTGAFLFNLTYDYKLNQTISYYQTFDYYDYGPTFGGGHDLHVYLNNGNGYNNTHSYEYPSSKGPYSYLSGTYQFDVAEVEVFKLDANLITVSGPTHLCPGSSVTLTSEVGDSYLWSSGQTTQSITVDQAGSYSVSVGGCSFSSTIAVTAEDNLAVDAGEDVTICETPAQLNAVATGSTSNNPSHVTRVDILDAPSFNGTPDDFTFLGGNLCNDGYQFFYNSELGQTTSIVTNPTGITFKLYYTPCTYSTIFNFKLNGNVIGSIVDNAYTCTCEPGGSGSYPRTISIDPNEFQPFWNFGSSNSISVEIVSTNSGVAMAGIVAEVLSPSELYSWSPSTGLSDASISNPEASPDVTTTYTVTFTKLNGCTATDEVTVNVDCNEAPVAVCQSLIVSANDNCQGTAVALDFNGGSTDADGDELTYSVSPAGPFALGTTNVVLTVTDPDGESSSCNTTITVENHAPSIYNVNSSDADGLFEIGTPISLTVMHVDENSTVATINWDDGSTSTVSNPTDTVTVPHIYNSAGVYSVTIIVTDGCGLTAKYILEYLVAYDPNGAFVTGGGWIDSPPGAYTANPALTGKANFGFVAKYQNGSTVPTGNTEFQFKAGNVNFNSTSYQWLVVAGNKAQFRGKGTINGTGNYKFLLTAIDGTKQNPDKFRIKILDSRDVVVYDNQQGLTDDSDAATIIGGGSIVIHNPKSGSSARYNGNSDAIEAETIFDPSSVTVYPMPFKDQFYVYVPGPTQESLHIQLFDITGKELIRKEGKTNTYIEVDSNGLKSGMYLIKVLKANGLAVRKIMKQ